MVEPQNSQPQNKHILTTITLIDSGIGGLSIYQDLRSSLPSYFQINYLMDNQFLPYGELNYSQLKQRLFYLAQYAIQKLQTELIVLACNTATTQLIAELRQEFSLPFVGVVPGVKPAAIYSKNQKIIVYATPATIKGQYLQELIRHYGQGCQFHLVGSSELVALSEAKFWFGLHLKQKKRLESILEKVVEYQIDTIVLGCTHFNFLYSEIRALIQKDIQVIDCYQAITQRIYSLIDIDIEKGKVAVADRLFVSKELTREQKEKLIILGLIYNKLPPSS